MGLTVYTTADLLESVKDRASWPDSTVTYTDARLLDWLDEEMLSYLMPEVIRRQEDYYTKYEDQTMTIGLARYRVPERAWGEKLLRVGYLDRSGIYVPLIRGCAEDGLAMTSNGCPSHFYLESSELVVYPAPDYAYTLRLHHYRRPSSLVATTAVSTVASVTTSTIVVSSAPAAWPTAAQDYDVIYGKTPHDWRAIDKSATRSGNTLTFSSFNPSTAGVVAGDYVTLAGETAVPNLPRDLMPLLAQLGALRYFEAIGDFDALSAGLGRLKFMAEKAGISLGNRVDEIASKGSGAWSLSGRGSPTQVS